MEEKELIENTQKGDLTSFSTLVKTYQGKVYAYLAVRLNNKHEAEDLTQEAFLTAYKKIKSFDTNMPFIAWIKGIAANLLRNHWRKKKAVASGSSSELEGLINSKIDSNNQDNSQVLEFMNHCISEADEESSKLILMRYKEDKPLKEITSLLSINHSTLTMRLHRIREALRKCINKKMAESL